MVFGINRHYHRNKVNELAEFAVEKAKTGKADAELLQTLEQLRKKVFNEDVIDRMGPDYYREIRTILLDTCKRTIKNENIAVIGQEVADILHKATEINEDRQRSKNNNADNLSKSVLEIYTDMVELTDDPVLLSVISSNVSTMNEDQNLWFNASGKNTYDRQVMRCLYLEERIFRKIKDEFYLQKIASHVIDQVTFDSASYKFGKKYPEHTGLALEVLENARDQHAKETAEYFAIDHYVGKLITETEFVPFVEEKELEERGLLKLDVAGDDLKQNLRVIQDFLVNKDQDVLAAYKNKFATEISVREAFSENDVTDNAKPEFKGVVDVSELKKFHTELEARCSQPQVV